jgi:hypothetical protein
MPVDAKASSRRADVDCIDEGLGWRGEGATEAAGVKEKTGVRELLEGDGIAGIAGTVGIDGIASRGLLLLDPEVGSDGIEEWRELNRSELGCKLLGKELLDDEIRCELLNEEV